MANCPAACGDHRSVGFCSREDLMASKAAARNTPRAGRAQAVPPSQERGVRRRLLESAPTPARAVWANKEFCNPQLSRFSRWLNPCVVAACRPPIPPLGCLFYFFLSFSRGSRGGYPLAALGSEEWCNPSHGGVFSDGRPSVHGVACECVTHTHTELPLLRLPRLVPEARRVSPTSPRT